MGEAAEESIERDLDYYLDEELSETEEDWQEELNGLGSDPGVDPNDWMDDV